MGKVGAEGGPWVTVRGVAIREASREPVKSAEPRRGWGAGETRSGVRVELCRSLGRPASERTQLGRSGESDRPVEGGSGKEGGSGPAGRLGLPSCCGDWDGLDQAAAKEAGTSSRALEDF